MKFIHPLILSAGLLLLCSCTIIDATRVSQAAVVPSNPLVMPVGKNWQVIEEPPKLANERERLPFQLEQSVQPGVAKPVSSRENRKIETTR